QRRLPAELPRRAGQGRLVEDAGLVQAERRRLTRRASLTNRRLPALDGRQSPSPPPGAERVRVRWGIPERSSIPTSPSHRWRDGPLPLRPEGRGGVYSAAAWSGPRARSTRGLTSPIISSIERIAALC